MHEHKQSVKNMGEKNENCTLLFLFLWSYSFLLYTVSHLFAKE